MHDMTTLHHHDTAHAFVAEGAGRPGMPLGAAGADPDRAGAKPKRHGGTGLPALARKLYEFGHRRSRFLPPWLFGEPAWYILLDLYASEAEGRAISVTSASVASGAPSTTGLRVVRVLEDRGLVCKGRTGSDRRRSDVQLTSAGRDAIERILLELQPVFGAFPNGLAC